MPTTVTLTLAHPLNSAQVERMHAKEIKNYSPGDTITVPIEDARAIINAGFAKDVEPGNTKQVQAALSPSDSSGSAKSVKSAN